MTDRYLISALIYFLLEGKVSILARYFFAYCGDLFRAG
jgi:hypothetical protein